MVMIVVASVVVVVVQTQLNLESHREWLIMPQWHVWGCVGVVMVVAGWDGSVGKIQYRHCPPVHTQQPDPSPPAPHPNPPLVNIVMVLGSRIV